MFGASLRQGTTFLQNIHVLPKNKAKEQRKKVKEKLLKRLFLQASDLILDMRSALLLFLGFVLDMRSMLLLIWRFILNMRSMLLLISGFILDMGSKCIIGSKNGLSAAYSALHRRKRHLKFNFDTSNTDILQKKAHSAQILLNII